MTKPLYFEVSPRRTGKTTRLLRFAANTQPSLVVCSTTYSRDYIKKLAREKIPFVNLPGTSFVTWHQVQENLRCYNLNIEFKAVCFDEFDFIAPDIPVLANGYYVTTPKKFRSWEELIKTPPVDTFCALMQATRFQYHRYPAELLEVEKEKNDRPITT